MHYLKKLSVGMMMIIGVSVNCPVFASDEPDIVDGRAYMEDVYQSMGEIENLHSDIAVELKTPIMEVVSISSVEIFLKPEIIGKIVTKATIRDLKDGLDKMQIAQYIEQIGDKIVIYSELDKKWEKQTMQSSLKDLQEQAINGQFPQEYIKDVQIKNQTADDVNLVVTVEMKELRKVVDEALVEIEKESKKKPTDNDAKMRELVNHIFDNMDNVSYMLRIDKKTNYITSAYIDLSDPVQRSMEMIIDTMISEEKERAIYKLLSKEIKLTIQEDFSKFNQVKKIVIPKKVREKAIESKIVENNKIDVATEIKNMAA